MQRYPGDTENKPEYDHAIYDDTPPFEQSIPSKTLAHLQINDGHRQKASHHEWIPFTNNIAKIQQLVAEIDSREITSELNIRETICNNVELGQWLPMLSYHGGWSRRDVSMAKSDQPDTGQLDRSMQAKHTLPTMLHRPSLCKEQFTTKPLVNNTCNSSHDTGQILEKAVVQNGSCANVQFNLAENISPVPQISQEHIVYRNILGVERENTVDRHAGQILQENFTNCGDYIKLSSNFVCFCVVIILMGHPKMSTFLHVQLSY